MICSLCPNTAVCFIRLPTVVQVLCYTCGLQARDYGHTLKRIKWRPTYTTKATDGSPKPTKP